MTGSYEEEMRWTAHDVVRVLSFELMKRYTVIAILDVICDI